MIKRKEYREQCKIPFVMDITDPAAVLNNFLRVCCVDSVAGKHVDFE